MISTYSYEHLYTTDFSIEEYDKYKESLDSSDSIIKNITLEILKNKCIEDEK